MQNDGSGGADVVTVSSGEHLNYGAHSAGFRRNPPESGGPLGISDAKRLAIERHISACEHLAFGLAVTVWEVFCQG